MRNKLRLLPTTENGQNDTVICNFNFIDSKYPQGWYETAVYGDNSIYVDNGKLVLDMKGTTGLSDRNRIYYRLSQYLRDSQITDDYITEVKVDLSEQNWTNVGDYYYYFVVGEYYECDVTGNGFGGKVGAYFTINKDNSDQLHLSAGIFYDTDNASDSETQGSTYQNYFETIANTTTDDVIYIRVGKVTGSTANDLTNGTEYIIAQYSLDGINWYYVDDATYGLSYDALIGTTDIVGLDDIYIYTRDGEGNNEDNKIYVDYIKVFDSTYLDYVGTVGGSGLESLSGGNPTSYNYLEYNRFLLREYQYDYSDNFADSNLDTSIWDSIVISDTNLVSYVEEDEHLKITNDGGATHPYIRVRSTAADTLLDEDDDYSVTYRFDISDVGHYDQSDVEHYDRVDAELLYNRVDGDYGPFMLIRIYFRTSEGQSHSTGESGEKELFIRGYFRDDDTTLSYVDTTYDMWWDPVPNDGILYIKFEKIGDRVHGYYKVGENGSYQRINEMTFDKNYTLKLFDFGYRQSQASGILYVEDVSFEKLYKAEDTRAASYTIDLSDIGHIEKYTQDQAPINEYDYELINGNRKIRNKYRNQFEYDYSFMDYPWKFRNILDSISQKAAWELYDEDYDDTEHRDVVVLDSIPFEYHNDKLDYAHGTVVFKSLETKTDVGIDVQYKHNHILYDRGITATTDGTALSGYEYIDYYVDTSFSTKLNVYLIHDAIRIQATYNGQTKDIPTNEMVTFTPATGINRIRFRITAIEAVEYEISHLLIWGV
jgi:hypothetical protein